MSVSVSFHCITNIPTLSGFRQHNLLFFIVLWLVWMVLLSLLAQLGLDDLQQPL